MCSFFAGERDEPVSSRINILLVVAVLTGLAGLVGTQTRAAFLGVFVCLLVALVQTIRRRGLLSHDRMTIVKGLLVFSLVVGLLGWLTNGALHKRVAVEQTTIDAVLSGNLESIPFTSMGVRIHSWAEALKWIAERPLTGWGRDARSDVIKLADHFPKRIRENFGHLHNGYLEVLLGFGAVGFVFLCFLWIVLLRRIKFAASTDLYAFALYGTVFFLVLNMFESFFVKWSGEFAVSLFIAAGYSQYLAKSLGDDPAPKPAT
jgi:O-antigen ligase